MKEHEQEYKYEYENEKGFQHAYHYFYYCDKVGKKRRQFWHSMKESQVKEDDE